VEVVMKAIGKGLLVGAAGVLLYGAFRRRGVDLDKYFGGTAAVVTGGASGIGRALVEGLVAHGARVLAVDIDEQALAALAREVPGVAVLRLDVTDEDATVRLVEEAVDRLGGLDVVFANAGVFWSAPFLAMAGADIERLVAVNLTSQIELTRVLLPFFIGQGRGVIAYTGSLSAHVHSPLHSVYTGTKGGLHNFVAAVRRELRRELPPGASIQLTIVQPNFTRTNLTAQEIWDELEKKYPLQSPSRVARAALRGVARGDREVFVNFADQLLKWTERVAPPAIDALFRWGITDEIIEKAIAFAAEGKTAAPSGCGEELL
jgi:NAD(P)-dependent dehydrogenase (short-subunit alcohol dehydrogenase family)